MRACECVWKRAPSQDFGESLEGAESGEVSYAHNWKSGLIGSLALLDRWFRVCSL